MEQHIDLILILAILILVGIWLLFVYSLVIKFKIYKLNYINKYENNNITDNGFNLDRLRLEKSFLS